MFVNESVGSMESKEKAPVATGGKVWTIPVPRSDVVRLSVNLNEETADALKKLAADKGITITEVMRRAVAVTKFLYDEQDKGKTIQVVSRKGKIRNVILTR